MAEPPPRNEQIRVSVLMPVHDAAPFVGAAVESVLAQTYPGFELLVIDDGSTDGSAAIVADLAARDPRIRFRARQNRGLTETLNELAGLARGAYLARMDADDLCLPDRFRLQVARMDAEPDLLVLGGHAIYSDETMAPIIVPNLPLDHDAIDAGNLVGTVSLAHPAVMIRASGLEAAGGYDPRFEAAEDLDLWLRLAEHGRLANLPDVVLRYRLVESGVSGASRARQAEAVRGACAAARHRRNLPERAIDYRDWRPGTDRRSRAFFALKWGWQAWNAGNRDTARRFFRKALRISPLSLDAWKAVVAGTRRHR